MIGAALLFVQCIRNIDSITGNHLWNCASCVTPTGEFGYNTDGSLFSHVGAYNFKSPGGAEWDAYCSRTGRLWPGSAPMIGPQL